MILTASKEQAAARRQRYVTPGGAETFVSTYIGTNKMELLAQGNAKGRAVQAAPDGPMAYLVEQAPGSIVDAHYHGVDQFQIFIGGGGHIGTHLLEGLTVHFAAPHSPYGPIAAGPQGVQYLTLRRNWDPGAQWMPAAAAALRGMPSRKHATFTSPPLERCADPRKLDGMSCTNVMPQAEGGPGAWWLCGGPGAAIAAGGSTGRFWYVMAGAVKVGEADVAQGGCVFLADQDHPECRAGPQGVELVQVQFPAT